MIDGVPADLTWITPYSGIPVIGLSESGDNMFLVCLYGVMRYSRSKDSVALAEHLEQVAKVVRDNA